MALPVSPQVTPVARLALVAGFARVPITSRWQSSAWRLVWVHPADQGPPGSDATPADALETVANETALEIHRDEAEGYWLNVTAAEPSIFVLWRAEEGTPCALAATLSYHEAGRWMDGGETVDRVLMPAEMTAWLSDWVNRTYQPQQRKRTRGPRPSFLSRDEFARFAGQADAPRPPQDKP